MLHLRENITKVQSPAIIAHGVNCSSAMGSGVARALYMKWPSVKEHYRKTGSMILGDVQFVEVEESLVVANCFTQKNYGRDGRRYADPEAIRKALAAVVFYALGELGIGHVHLPKIGCGLGGLDWVKDVEPILVSLEEIHEITFVVCEI